VNNRTIVVYETVIDIDGRGPADDGTKVYRFGTRRQAEQFIAGKTLYGQPATVDEAEVPIRLAQRWGFA
jgi:hypothetical protein